MNGIERSLGVCGGDALRAEDLARAWQHVEANRHEVDEAIARNEAA